MVLIPNGGILYWSCNTPGSLSTPLKGRSTDRSTELEQVGSNCPAHLCGSSPSSPMLSQRSFLYTHTCTQLISGRRKLNIRLPCHPTHSAVKIPLRLLFSETPLSPLTLISMERAGNIQISYNTEPSPKL